MTVTDVLDPDTVNIPNAEDAQTISLTTPNGSVITCATAQKASTLTAQDSDYSYPVGFLDFCASSATSATEIRVIFVTDQDIADVVLRKYNPLTQTYRTVTDAVLSATSLNGQNAIQAIYTITDNGPLDINPATGELRDPVGLGVPLGSTNNSTAATAGAATANAPLAGFNRLSLAGIVTVLLVIVISAGSIISLRARRF